MHGRLLLKVDIPLPPVGRPLALATPPWPTHMNPSPIYDAPFSWIFFVGPRVFDRCRLKLQHTNPQRLFLCFSYVFVSSSTFQGFFCDNLYAGVCQTVGSNILVKYRPWAQWFEARTSKIVVHCQMWTRCKCSTFSPTGATGRFSTTLRLCRICPRLFPKERHLFREERFPRAIFLKMV